MKIIIRWRPLTLSGIALLGLALRLYGLDWDQLASRYQFLLHLYGPGFAYGNNFHPDERQIMFHVVQLAWPKSWSQFFDAANSPLNPHFFAYGSFPLYLLASVGNILSHFSPGLATFASLTLTGRVLNAIFDTGTILLTGWLALLLIPDRTPGRRYAWSVALLAAALVAFTPFQIQLSHFYIVDTMLLFFVTLTVFACVKLIDTDKPIRWSLIVGLAYGLALATKFSAAPLAVPLLAALVLRWYKSGFSSVVPAIFFSAAATILSFLIAMPYALLDRTEFLQQISYQGDLARGLIDLPYVRQFAGTTPVVYELQNMVLWGMGVALGIAALAALLWLCWRVWKRDAGPWLVVLSWVLVYGAINCSFYVKFMRYMLPIYPFLTLMAAAGLLALLHWVKSKEWHFKKIPLTILPYGAIAIVLAGTIFQGLALLNVYSQPNTRIQASPWIYSHIKPGSVLTYEQWDDALPVAVDGHDPSIYQQATYPGANGQPQQGLDLYGDDTLAKAQQLANLLPTLNAITMASDRLDKSIPRLPARYPLTIHYYQLLFSGLLGFHLAAQFEVRPNLLGITLNDSGADESYSVFDHPTVRIFVRDNPYPYSSAQLLQKLLDGVQLPTPGTGLSGTQHSLLLSARQIDDDQQSPSFGSQFPQNSPSNTYPVFFWWLALIFLGLLAYPLTFSALRGLADRGYIFSKMLGILLLAYFAWMLANLHLIAFSHLSMVIVCLALLLLAIVLYMWQRRAIGEFIRQRWRLLLIEEGIYTLAFLAFVGIRSLNPDLWNPYLGGEKPMELAFLNAVLRSPYMPPYDPWFAGGYINYYYYGYIIVGTLIKLTGIVPTTAFNLAIPTLFALTFTGVVTLVYSFTRRFSLALLGGYFAALIGNFDGVLQLKQQFATLLVHLQPPAFNYWQSSRIIPFTINEFPFWSFLFADLHPHVIDLPITTFMLGIVAALLLFDRTDVLPSERIRGNAALYVLYGIAAFVFGTIACVNPWDMPVYALMLAAVFILRTIQVKRGLKKLELFISLAFTFVTLAFLGVTGYLLYWPFYASYQQLYVNGLGLVGQGTTLSDYLTISGLWIFLALSFFLLELYLWWSRARVSRPGNLAVAGYKVAPVPARQVAGYLLLCGVVLTFAVLLGLKMLLLLLIVLGVFLFVMWSRDRSILRLKDPSVEAEVIGPLEWSAAAFHSSGPITSASTFIYLLLLMGLCISLGVEIVYIRDFLDGGNYERMNTVFKFSMQAWLCFGVGGALAVERLWNYLRGLVRQAWLLIFALLILGCSIFLPLGTLSRIDDHQVWAAAILPAQSASYIPTLDGFAFARSWYPGDAKAINWLNENVTGSPIILEATAPISYQWFSRVSVFTGLPDVLGWADHEDEQRYNYQPLNRMTDIGIIYTTPDPAQAIELLYYYHVRYIYVGELEREAYAQQSTAGLDKFDRMVGNTLRLVYRSDGVTIYEVL